MQVKLARNIANGTPKTVVGSLKKICKSSYNFEWEKKLVFAWELTKFFKHFLVLHFFANCQFTKVEILSFLCEGKNGQMMGIAGY